MEHLSHDTRDGGFSGTGISCKHVMLALEGIGFASLDLQVEESRQVADFLLDSLQSHHAVEFL